MAQRLVRAKKKIGVAGIPFVIPEGEALAAAARRRADRRLPHLQRGLPRSRRGGAGRRRDLAGRAGGAVAARPGRGLGAARAADESVGAGRRASRRVRPAGAAVRAGPQPLGPGRRSPGRRATWSGRPGCAVPGGSSCRRAIAACHAEAPRWEDTDWLQILTLYDVLLHHDPSPVIRLNHAIALGQVQGPAAALAELDALADRLGDYHLFHATRAQLLAVLGSARRGSGGERPRARRSPHNPVEQELLRSRIAAYDG